jgi:predicted nucleic acid-binding protein
VVSCIIDTSVWIDFFRGKLKSGTLNFLSEMIPLRMTGITDIIRHEILVGAASKPERQQLRGLLSPLPCLRIQEDRLEEFDDFAWNLRNHGLMGKYTDVAIAFVCHSNKLPLLSFDNFFTHLARKNLIKTIANI